MITSLPELFNFCVFTVPLVLLDDRKHIRSLRVVTGSNRAKSAPNQEKKCVLFNDYLVETCYLLI